MQCSKSCAMPQAPACRNDRCPASQVQLSARPGHVTRGYTHIATREEEGEKKRAKKGGEEKKGLSIHMSASLRVSFLGPSKLHLHSEASAGPIVQTSWNPPGAANQRGRTNHKDEGGDGGGNHPP